MATPTTKEIDRRLLDYGSPQGDAAHRQGGSPRTQDARPSRSLFGSGIVWARTELGATLVATSVVENNIAMSAARLVAKYNGRVMFPPKIDGVLGQRRDGCAGCGTRQFRSLGRLDLSKCPQPCTLWPNKAYAESTTSKRSIPT